MSLLTKNMAARTELHKCYYALWLIFSLSHLNCQATNRVSSNLQNLITATSKIARFCKSMYMELNLDGIFGLRMAEGQLIRILNAYQEGDYHRPLPKSILGEVQSIRAELTSTANMAIPHLHDADKTYFLKFKEIVAKPWLLVYPYRKLKRTTTRLHFIPGPGFNEDESDRCFRGVIGSEGVDSCTLLPECLHLMTSKGKGGYTLTHQLLYLIMANQECPHVLLEKLSELKIDLANLLNSYSEQLWLEIKKEYPPKVDDQDMFIEQVLLGTQLGYLEFFQNDWLKTILSWQNLNGCFGQQLSEEDLNYPKRKILNEKVLKDGCLSHTTGIAAALLASYLRHSLHLQFSSAEEEEQKKFVRKPPVKPKPFRQNRPMSTRLTTLFAFLSLLFLLYFLWKRLRRQRRFWAILHF